MTFKSLLNIPEYLFSGVLNRVADPLERKRVLISIKMAFAQIAIYLSLFIYATIKGYNSGSTYYTLISAGMIVLMMLLTYHGHPKYGMSFGLILTCISVVFLAKRAGPASGADHYYVLLSVVPFVFFGYKDRYLAIGLLAFASTCFLVTRLVPFSFVEPMVLTPQQSQVFFVANTIFDAILTAYALFSILTINQLAERELLDQNNELKRVNHELDKFVYSASHDLSAPLKSIGGLVQIAKMENPPVAVDQYLNLMQKSIAKLENFIRDIIDYSRNSRMPLKHEEIDILVLIRSIWDDHRYYLKRETKIELFIENRLLTPLYSDETRLRIIFNNLLSNAIKFHVEEKRERPCVTVIIDETEESFIFTVADNGQGISAQIKQEIFKMFFRGNASVPGSGLGLYILKESVEKLNGTVSVESEEGAGATFCVTIPKAHSLSSD